MSYDPTTNPRYLGIDDITDIELEVAEKQRELAEVELKLETFQTEGWKLIEDDLRSKVQENFRRLASENVKTMDAVSLERGSMRSINALLGEPARLELRRALLIDELSSLTER